ncbi:MAG: glycerophosphodiester phosphodiesterase [Tenacibaculum sp.]
MKEPIKEHKSALLKYSILQVFVVILLVVFFACKAKTNQLKDKLVIAHRGASGYLPEHTMEAKAMAYATMPNYIEQDLVLSKDNVPVVIHDIYLDEVTDVAKVFPDRKRADGRYYVIDFLFEELQQLQVSERFDSSTGRQVYPNRFPKGKGNFKLHSLQQEIELIQGLNASTGNNIGIYPEIKNPTFHHKNNKDLAKITLSVLNSYGYSSKSDLCILQCFDAKELKRIRKQLQSNLYLVQLIEFPEQAKQLEKYASYADGIGCWYKQILGKKEKGKWIFSSLVNDAHKLNLTVHAYTLKYDQHDEFSSFNQMMQVLFDQANIDGAFTDFPDKVINYLKQK